MLPDPSQPELATRSRWTGASKAAVLLGLAVVVALVVVIASVKGGKEESSAVEPPRLVETLGPDSPLGSYEDEQFAVRSFEAANGAGSYTGWAGSSPENGKLKVFWKGTLPQELRSHLEGLSQALPIEIYATKYSQAELQDAANQIRPELFAKGVCAGSVAYGVDALQYITDKDPESLDLPSKTGAGIPIVVTQGSCPTTS